MDLASWWVTVQIVDIFDMGKLALILKEPSKIAADNTFIFLCPQLWRIWGDVLVWACLSICLSIQLSIHNIFWKLGSLRTAYFRILKFYTLHVYEK